MAHASKPAGDMAMVTGGGDGRCRCGVVIQSDVKSWLGMYCGGYGGEYRLLSDASLYRSCFLPSTHEDIAQCRGTERLMYIDGFIARITLDTVRAQDDYSIPLLYSN